MSFSPLPRTLFIVDDDTPNLIRTTLAPLFPDAKIHPFTALYQAGKALEDGIVPDLVFLDAFNYNSDDKKRGGHNAVDLLLLMKKKGLIPPYPPMIFYSAEDVCAEASYNHFVEICKAHHLAATATFTNLHEIDALEAIKRGTNLRGFYHAPSTLRRFLNETYDLSLPIGLQPLPKTIIVIDDYQSKHREKQFRAIFPDARILRFVSPEEYLEAHASLQAPDMIVCDSNFMTFMGHCKNRQSTRERLSQLMRAVDRTFPDLDLPALLILSDNFQNGRLLKGALDNDFKRSSLLTVSVVACDPDEVAFAVALCTNALPELPARDRGEFLAFLYQAYNMNFPTDPASLGTLMENNLFLSIKETGLSIRKLIPLLPRIRQSLEEGLFELPSAPLEKASFPFLHGVGPALAAPLTFDVRATDGWSILFTEYLSLENFTSLLGKMAGLVALSSDLPGHLALLARAHNLPFLCAPQHRLWPSDPEETPILMQDGEELLLKEGDVVSLYPHLKVLFQGRVLPITQPKDKPDWFAALKEVLSNWHYENDVTTPQILASVDALSQNGKDAEGIGLVRSELLLCGKKESADALRQSLLAPTAETLAVIEKETTRHVALLAQGAKPLRYRLLDLVPSELLSAKELVAMGQRYGAPLCHGVALARRDPSIYRAQLKGLFATGLPTDAPPLEILIPSAKSQDDVLFVRTLANELGFPPASYRLGSMLETLEAGNSIHEIAPLCAFLNIGLNDLTAAHFCCARNNWEKRHELMRESGCGEDPFLKIDPTLAAWVAEKVSLARGANPLLKIALCGEHVCDPTTLDRIQPWTVDALCVPPTENNLTILPLLYQLRTFELHTGVPFHPENKGKTPSPEALIG